MTRKPRPKPATKELTRAEYLKLREEREGLPGIVVIGGHVVSDRFGELYGDGPMKDGDLPESLPKLTPEQQAAYDNMRASPGILFDPDGNVVFDGEAEALGAPPFKTRAEFDAQQARLQELLAARRKEREAEARAMTHEELPESLKKKPRPAPKPVDRRTS
jgi:hypothetical protein